MADVVICCSDKDQATARQLEDSLERAGYSVWWDPQASSDFWSSDAVVDRIGEAKAAIALWSEASASLPMFRAQANAARTKKKLIQASADGLRPPEPFNKMHVAPIFDWRGETGHPGLKTIVSELERLCRPRNGTSHPRAPKAQPVQAAPPAAPRTGRWLDALVPLAILGCVGAGALGWASTRFSLGQEARPQEAAPAPRAAAPIAARPVIAAPQAALPAIAPPAAALTEAPAPAPAVAPPPAIKPRKAAPKAKASAAKTAARPKVRYKYSDNMRLFCQRAGKATKECRTFRRNTARRRRG